MKKDQAYYSRKQHRNKQETNYVTKKCVTIEVRQGYDWGGYSFLRPISFYSSFYITFMAVDVVSEDLAGFTNM